MKKILLYCLVGLLLGQALHAQGPTLDKYDYSHRIHWLYGAFDSGLNVPVFAADPTSGLTDVYYNSVSHKHRFLDNGVWVEYGTSGVNAFTFTNGITNTSGIVTLGGNLIQNTFINGRFAINFGNVLPTPNNISSFGVSTYNGVSINDSLTGSYVLNNGTMALTSLGKITLNSNLQDIEIFGLPATFDSNLNKPLVWNPGTKKISQGFWFGDGDVIQSGSGFAAGMLTLARNNGLPAITIPLDGRYIINETDPIWTAASGNYYTKTNLQTSGQALVHWNNITNAPSFVTTEIDPVFLASPAHSIATTDITHWNQAYNKYVVSGSYAAGTITFLSRDGTTAFLVSGLSAGGTVTSVALNTPPWLTVAGSPVTSSGTLAISATGGQTANQFLATPNGSAGALGLRAIVLADLPTIPAAKTSGFAAVATTGAYGDLSGTPAPYTLPIATPTLLGGIKVGTNLSIDPVTGILSATSGGTVTSIAMNVPTWLTVSPASPITTSGTFSITATGGQTQNLFLATPNGATGALGLRSIVLADLPTIPSTKTSGFATVATTGAYADLSGLPTIPAAQIQSDWTQATTSALDFIKHKPTLATVATSGLYSDLSGAPSIPPFLTFPYSVVKDGSNNVTLLNDLNTPGNYNVYSTTSVGVKGWQTLSGMIAAIGFAPAGGNTQIQYNNSGSFGASSLFTFDNTNRTHVIGGSSNNNNITTTLTGDVYLQNPTVSSVTQKQLFSQGGNMSMISGQAALNSIGNTTFANSTDIRSINVEYGFEIMYTITSANQTRTGVLVISNAGSVVATQEFGHATTNSDAGLNAFIIFASWNSGAARVDFVASNINNISGCTIYYTIRALGAPGA